MTIFHWICIIGFIVCLSACFYFMLKILMSGAPVDHAQSKGEIRPAIVYSFTKAMSPAKKETAFKHLPTYTGGLLYHMGTFLGFITLALIFFKVSLPLWLTYLIAGLLLVSAISGIAILIKRIVTPKVRNLSNPDDYISNSLVSIFHLLVAATLLLPLIEPVLLVYAAILFLYIPVGKLRHTVYFFTSRIHLAIFYGRRGVWPIKRREI